MAVVVGLATQSQVDVFVTGSNKRSPPDPSLQFGDVGENQKKKSKSTSTPTNPIVGRAQRGSEQSRYLSIMYALDAFDARLLPAWRGLGALAAHSDGQPFAAALLPARHDGDALASTRTADARGTLATPETSWTIGTPGHVACVSCDRRSLVVLDAVSELDLVMSKCASIFFFVSVAPRKKR